MCDRTRPPRGPTSRPETRPPTKSFFHKTKPDVASPSEDRATSSVITSVNQSGTSISSPASMGQSDLSISKPATNTPVIANTVQTVAIAAQQTSSQPMIIPSVQSIVPKPIDPKVSAANQAAAILSHFTLVQQPANPVVSSATRGQSQSELVLIDSSDDESESSGRSQSSTPSSGSINAGQKLPNQAVEILMDFKKKVGIDNSNYQVSARGGQGLV